MASAPIGAAYAGLMTSSLTACLAREKTEVSSRSIAKAASTASFLMALLSAIILLVETSAYAAASYAKISPSPLASSFSQQQSAPRPGTAVWIGVPSHRIEKK
eukprot:TRINITY_DN25638_c0_g1_i2.p2 TRINITY_DN25638_c0_g1~~TRINITY_DN25638_c0_g1_i2.p2  ORF type:complete len:103 (-),score=16.42 TRINITY_DN25638_c0_g1_i2:29-337(-)